MEMNLVCAPKGRRTIAGGERSEPPVDTQSVKPWKGAQKMLSPFQGFTPSDINPGFASAHPGL